MSRTKHILSYSIPIVILLFFLFGSFFAPHDPTATNIRGKYLSSSAEYPFGTDDFGRCEFSRILEGGKITLGIVLVGSAIVILLGIFFGILLAKTGRRRNILAESILNAVTAIPPVAYLIIFIGIWGNSIPTMLVALTASLVLRMIKLVSIHPRSAESAGSREALPGPLPADTTRASQTASEAGRSSARSANTTPPAGESNSR